MKAEDLPDDDEEQYGDGSGEPLEETEDMKESIPEGNHRLLVCHPISKQSIWLVGWLVGVG
jgi:hypothetical protein